MSLTLTLQTYAEGLARLFYPASCHACQDLLALEASVLCVPCQVQLEACRLNRLYMPGPEPIPGISESWALYLYTDRVRQLISDFKYEGQRRVLDVFLPALAEACKIISGFQYYDGIVEIPSDPGRKQDRPYSPVHLITRQAAQELSLPLLSRLRKIRTTQPQMELGFEERHYNLREAFQADPVQTTGKKLLLIDDVVTTGSTASEAAKALREAGAKRVDLLTLARAERAV